MNNSEGKKHKCAACEYATNDWSHLTQHERVHTGEKPYKCNQCTSAFAQFSALTTHIRKHTDEKPYKCDQCTSAFTTSSALTTHKRRHTGEKPYKCDQCNYACETSSDLKMHKRRHTGEKPYKCEECSYASSHIWNLKIHKRKHTKENPRGKGLKPCSVQLRRLSVERIHSLTKRTSSNDAMIKHEPAQDKTDDHYDSSEGHPCVKLEFSTIKKEPLDFIDNVPVSSIVKRDYAECRDVDG